MLGMHPCTGTLTQLGAQLGPGEIKQKPNDDEVEWRGQCYNLPTRLLVNSFQDVEGMVKFNNPHGTVDLNWDPEYVNDPGDADAWSDDDTARVFVGRGVCIETFASSMEEEMAGFKSLPYEPMRHLIGAMIRDHASRVYIRSDEFEFGFKHTLDEWPDGVAAVTRFTQMVGWCCASWAATPPDPNAMAAIQAISYGGGAAQAGHYAPIKMHCNYCRSTFLLTPASVCANCGAPAQG